MSSEDKCNSVPWNMEAKNGKKAYFTEENFCRLLGNSSDTHESRMAERLKKVGIIPEPSLEAVAKIKDEPPALVPAAEVKREPEFKRRTKPGLRKQINAETVLDPSSIPNTQIHEMKPNVPTAPLSSLNHNLTLQNNEENNIQILRPAGDVAKEYEANKHVKGPRNSTESIQENLEKPIVNCEESAADFGVMKKEAVEVKVKRRQSRETERRGEETHEEIMKNREKLPDTLQAHHQEIRGETVNEFEAKISKEDVVFNSGEAFTGYATPEEVNAETTDTETKAVNIDTADTAPVDVDDPLTTFRPKSFYKHISEAVETEPETVTEDAIAEEMAAEQTQQRVETTRNNRTTVPFPREGPFQGRQSDARNTGFVSAKVEKQNQAGTSNNPQGGQAGNVTNVDVNTGDGEKKREFVKLDPNFFNVKDRSEKNKYAPLIANKKPQNRRSKLTGQQQKQYLEMSKHYGHYVALDEQSTDENLVKYKRLLEDVKKEQFTFQCYLKRTAYQCKADYEYVHPEVDKYINVMSMTKRKRALSYPRFYVPEKRIFLTDEPDEQAPCLQHVRPLLELGTVSKLALPSVIPGLPQPCTPTNFKKITDIDPIPRDNFRGPYVWNREECSQDMNAEQLGVPNKCDVIMSASVIQHLIDTQGKACHYWEIPITVREYQISENGNKSTHKVAFLDKPFKKLPEMTPKDKNQIYQKRAIRAVAKRQQQRGHAFVSVKPIHTVEKATSLEALEHHMVELEATLQEGVKEKQTDVSNSLESFEGPVEGEGDGVEVVGEKRKRRRKKGKGGPGGAGNHTGGAEGPGGGAAKQRDMFDLEAGDIDDLETFGSSTRSRSLDTSSRSLRNDNSDEAAATSTGMKLKSPKQCQQVAMPTGPTNPNSNASSPSKSALSQSSSHAATKSPGVTGVQAKSTAKPSENELEKLKNELQSIKNLARSDSVKSSEKSVFTKFAATLRTQTQSSMAGATGSTVRTEKGGISIASVPGNAASPMCNTHENRNELERDKRSASSMSSDSKLLAHNESEDIEKSSQETDTICHAAVPEANKRNKDEVEAPDAATEIANKLNKDRIEGPSAIEIDEPETSNKDQSCENDDELITDNPDGNVVNVPGKKKTGKPGTSLSAKKQQMQVINSKLRQRSTDSPLAPSSAVESMAGPSCGVNGRTRSTSNVSDKKTGESDKKLDEMAEEEGSDEDSSVAGLVIDDDDSESEDGLVIDVPEEITTPVNTKRKRTSSVAKPKENKSNQSANVNNKLTLPNKSNQTSNVNKLTAPKSEIDPPTAIVKEESMEESTVTRRGGKRRSTSSAQNETPVPTKRNLRSSVSSADIKPGTNSTTTVTPRRTTRGSVTKMERPETEKDVDPDTPEQGRGRGRGRKRSLRNERPSRSCSASSDRSTTTIGSDAGSIGQPTGRLTRRSVNTDTATKDQTDPPAPVVPTPVKRRRGRPPKNKPKPDVTDAKTESKEDITDAVTKPKQESIDSIDTANLETKSKQKSVDKSRSVGDEAENMDVDNANSENYREEDETSLVINEDLTLGVGDSIVKVKEESMEESIVTGRGGKRRSTSSAQIDAPVPNLKDTHNKDVEMKPVAAGHSSDVSDIEEDAEEIVSPRRKRVHRIIDDDEDDCANKGEVLDPTSETGKVNPGRRKGRQPTVKTKVQKSRSDVEAKKIKQMADAMKRRIEEKKKAPQTDNSSVAKDDLIKQSFGNIRRLSAETGPKAATTNDSLNKPETEYKPPINQKQTQPTQFAQIKPDTMSKASKQNQTQNGASSAETKPGPRLNPGAHSGSSSVNDTASEQDSEQTAPPEVEFGIDSILQNSSEFRPRADVNKGSLIEKIAATHGMSHVLLPVNDNVTYNQWHIGDINVLIRAKYHGFIQQQGLVHISPKMEYQPFFGFEKETVNEVARNWISVYVRPNSSLVRVRVNPFNSEMMKIDHIEYKDLIPADSTFSTNQAFTDLHLQLANIKQLPVGQYLMKNNPRKDMVTILKAATPENNSGAFDLQLRHANFTTKPDSVPPVQWVPIDTKLLLPHHRKMNLVPCTYPPKDVKFKPSAGGKQQTGGKQQKKRNRGKKKKKGQQGPDASASSK